MAADMSEAPLSGPDCTRCGAPAAQHIRGRCPWPSLVGMREGREYSAVTGKQQGGPALSKQQQGGPALSKPVHLALAILLLVGAFGALIGAYANNRPDAQTCAIINQTNRSLGIAPSCVSGPTVGLLVTAAVLAGLGLVLLFIWSLRKD